MAEQPRGKPRDEEEAAAFKGMGHAITVIRERRGTSREELAEKCDLTPAELETVERGELDESWGIARRIAKSLRISLPALMMEAKEFAPGPGGKAGGKASSEAEGDGAIRGPRSDAAEAKAAVSPVVTEDYERQLWEELNSFLPEVVPEGAAEAAAVDAIALALMGHDEEISERYEQVKRLARDRAGYLRERLEEDNPISRARRRLYGDRA